MTDQYLNIVSFDIPFPANYGGVIDIYYKIRTLHKNGVKVILHCFQYNRDQSKELEKLCEQVYYYPRKTSLWVNFSVLPYTVYGRKNEQLIGNLLQNDYPILFEGLISTYYLKDQRLENRVKIFRESNVEHVYYYKLAQATKSVWEKLFFYVEGMKLQIYEPVVKKADMALLVSTNDQEYFKRKYPQLPSYFMPSFHPNDELESDPGKGDYILYHGNLAVSENEHAVLFLCEHVFPFLPCRCIVAGREPGKHLRQVIRDLPNVELIENPIEETMQQLIRQAHINIMITFQNTGLKLKLLHALLAGRFVVANQLMTGGSMLDGLCHIADTPEEMVACCKQLMTRTFTQEEMKSREEQLFPLFSNQYQAERLMRLVQEQEQRMKNS